MGRRVLVAGLTVGLVLLAGCTNVQKGSAAGSAVGTGTGALVGHSASGIGSGPGAIVGLALGAAGGALLADRYYGPEETGELEAASETIGSLSTELDSKDARLAEMAAALEQEKAQQKALLQAYEKARRKRSTLQANVPADVQVTTAEDRVTFTITSAVLFGSGKADLSVKGKAALKGAARTIRNEYPDNEIEVKGHTDNVPIRYSPYKSNWELSRDSPSPRTRPPQDASRTGEPRSLSGLPACA
ncbi:MAG: OmpA family protein [Planctomycetota bacterium]